MLIRVKEEGCTGFSEGWQGCSEGFPEDLKFYWFLAGHKVCKQLGICVGKDLNRVIVLITNFLCLAGGESSLTYVCISALD